MRKALLSMTAAALLLAGAGIARSQNAADTLVCQDIGSFKKYNCACGVGMGVLGRADHFGEDHKDISCVAAYHSLPQKMTVKAEVTSHTDPSAAVKRLMHEVDKEFRDYYGKPEPGYVIKTIDGNVVYAFGSAGWNYRWVSGDRVISLEFHDTKMTKPEPMEVLKAYLAKHRSALAATTTEELRSAPAETKWIRDEMDRRLWLCDKWLQRIPAGKAAAMPDDRSVESLRVFLDYRERYFGVKAEDEKNVLTGYLSSNNAAGIKARLREYKDWWTSNKDKEIHL
ncbi:MAG TPA: hypothetical protein VIX18_01475 [Nitrospirota bacterium]